LIFSVILPVFSAAAPLAVYRHMSLIASKKFSTRSVRWEKEHPERLRIEILERSAMLLSSPAARKPVPTARQSPSTLGENTIPYEDVLPFADVTRKFNM